MTCSAVVAGLAIFFGMQGAAQTPPSPAALERSCLRPPAGSLVTNPPEIRNLNASRPVNFTVHNIAPGQNCYLADGQVVAPTLRVNPGAAGETIVLRLTNQLPNLADKTQPANQESQAEIDATTTELCAGGMPPLNSTNLHFHGFNVSPMCHQDEVLKTVIKPNKTFEYRVEIPEKEPPGLYWYHPHIHMQSEGQVLSGLTGALIVEGIGKFNQRAAQLPERVFVLRDLEPSQEFPDSDDQLPAKDISINSVPIRYLGKGQYDPPAVIKMKPSQEQFWRVANTASDTYFDLQVIYDGTAQPLELVGRDGVPINSDGPKNQTLPVNHILLPPAGRAEFIIRGPGAGVKDAKLLTLNYETGTQGDNDPPRTIAIIDTPAKPTAAASASASAPESNVDLTQVSGDRFSGLNQEKPIQKRTLYFSENDTGTVFYITVLGNQPKVFDPNFTTPDITVQEGTTEDWIVQNQAQEAHAFHIHQIHFLVLESSDASEIGMLRDTINLPAWDGNPNTPFPQVKLRMDFRGKGSSITGTFVYHCHILEHEDKGMMAPIEVKSQKV